MEQTEVITCIVQRGESDKVVKAAIKAGAQGATVYYARGTGVRQKLGIFGAMLTPEKEVIIVVTNADRTDGIFDAIVSAAKLDKAGRGFAFVQKVERAVGFIEEQA
jgi:nitrogen regulatory protein PII